MMVRDSSRDVVATGAGVCCTLGDGLGQIESMLRRGRALPFVRYPPAVQAGACGQIFGSYGGELTAPRHQARFMGRAALMAYKAALAALAQSGLDRRDIAVVAGSGTGDVATHVEIQEKLSHRDGFRKVSPAVIPRLMASTVAANLATALCTSGPSFSVSAACAGGAYNILIAAELIEHGHVEAALAGGAAAVDPHFHAGFEAMRVLNGHDNEPPEPASRPDSSDRAGIVLGGGAGAVVVRNTGHAAPRGGTEPGA